MGDCKSTLPAMEGEGHVIAAAQHIVKALGATKNVSDDLRKILVDLEAHLSAMTANMELQGKGFVEVEERLKHAERKIMSWESCQMMIWDSGLKEASDYLEAVNEIQAVIEVLQGFSVGENMKQKALLSHAGSVQDRAMSRLEKELIHLVVQHRQDFEPKPMSFHAHGDDFVSDESFNLIEDESVEESSQTNVCHVESYKYVTDLVNEHVIPDLRSIASVMIASNYGDKFCNAFVGVRREAFDQYFACLDMGKSSIEDVLKMKWTSLSSEMKKWTCSMRTIIRYYLTNEKGLCDQVLGNLGSFNSDCFVKISEAPIFCLLNFGQAIAMAPYQPERLHRLLDMFEILADLLPEIDALFSEEAGSFFRIEFRALLERLGDSVRATFSEFLKAVSSHTSTHPLRGGGIHQLNKYVMNYIRILPDYGDTLNLLLKVQDADVSNVVSESDSEQGMSSFTSCPLACNLQLITSALEDSLKRKARLYEDDPLRHIFLMNNIHYMVQKVEGSKLGPYFGDEWIRKQTANFQQHARSYERATWSSALSLLKDDGHMGLGSPKTNLKERCKLFFNEFEKVYKSQTSWCIADPQLRADLQISTSLKVVHAYRTFYGRNFTHIDDRHGKYAAEDLETRLLDLFEGSPRSFHNSSRRGEASRFLGF